MRMRTQEGDAVLPARTWTEAMTYDAYGQPVTVKYPDFDNWDGTSIANRTVTYDYSALSQVAAYHWDAVTGGSRVPIDNNAIKGTAFKAAGQSQGRLD